MTIVCGCTCDNDNFFNWLNSLVICIYICNPTGLFECYKALPQKTRIIICNGLHHGHSIGFSFIKILCCCWYLTHGTHSVGFLNSSLWICTLFLVWSSIYITNQSCFRDIWSYLVYLRNRSSSIYVCKGSISIIGYSSFFTPTFFIMGFNSCTWSCLLSLCGLYCLRYFLSQSIQYYCVWINGMLILVG